MWLAPIKAYTSGNLWFSLKSPKRPLVINLSDSSDAPEGKVPEEPSVQVKSSAASPEEKQMDKITEPEIFDPMSKTKLGLLCRKSWPWKC